MTPVKSVADLAIGDEVEVREHYSYGSEPPRRRGSVVRVGKASAIIAFEGRHDHDTIRYVKRVTVERGGRFPGRRSKTNFYPILKLSARAIWIAECPKSRYVWGGGSTASTVIAMASAVRDEVEAVVEDLRIYSEWLQREPKGDA